MTVVLQTVSGRELDAYVNDLARLRIQIFRDYPYLYDGSEAYEQDYLQTYLASGNAMAVLALDHNLPAGQQVVGASTGVPMADENDEFRVPFEAAGINTERLFYCGESVLLPKYRGQGIYKGFFAGREAYVRSLGGFETICFCGVVRPANHPLKPADYVPLDDIWRHFGYAPRPDLQASYPWKDIDQQTATEHPMMFWLKPL
ncbi:GNAT family N-acetyltransferase [Oceanobacter mangrovi]|uniref:GNAT family N-acetyltransferase n=1 Tax=Oceanobacter mangrovi TaxID=2862510 RepID=UPI001C8EAFF8|nr:GNAT family N-acetyltransferase [Oceanobacter mangrovi]